MDIKVIRSDRKTLAIQITRAGVVVRAPRILSNAEIEAFVRKNRNWIEKHTAAASGSATDAADPLTADALKALAKEAGAYIPTRVEYYARMMGVTYGRISIRSQRTRWGSCSSKGNLNFNCLLMLAPPEAIDSVVVHELAHRREMNHSARFYAEIKRVFPEYERWHGWLKQNGAALLARLPEAR